MEGEVTEGWWRHRRGFSRWREGKRRKRAGSEEASRVRMGGVSTTCKNNRIGDDTAQIKFNPHHVIL
jgi:hypothetical protein